MKTFPSHHTMSLDRGLLIVLLIIAFIAGYWLVVTHQLPVYATSSSYAVETSIQPLNAVQINNVLCGSKSPACGTGDSLYTYAKQYRISDVYALAVFYSESDYGLLGVARGNRSIGNVRCGQEGYCNYASWQEGYAAWFDLIRNWYLNKWKLTSVETIATVYAPSSDDNNVNEYVANIKTEMARLKEVGK